MTMCGSSKADRQVHLLRLSQQVQKDAANARLARDELSRMVALYVLCIRPAYCRLLRHTVWTALLWTSADFVGAAEVDG
jgi:hypothetical protein